MKANELMIGDLVYDTILKCNTQVEILSLSGIRGDCNDNIWNEKTFEPIPLTSEILEKNGFDCNHDAKTSIDLVYHDCARITEYGEEVLEDGKMIRFVHELQHALRLCGIDKEIVL